uniref:Transmembrane protein 176 n=1 Tax=Sinocyclocheilus grahami TaxID=75366 RepID=A0A672KUA0_SINGR
VANTHTDREHASGAVAQIVIGLLIISYSIPLLSTEITMILNFGVPWWSGLMVSVFIALIMYYADIAFNPATECHMGSRQMCDHQYYATHFSTGLKTTISVVSMVQTAISSAFTVKLYNQRRNFTGYASLPIHNKRTRKKQ